MKIKYRNTLIEVEDDIIERAKRHNRVHGEGATVLADILGLCDSDKYGREWSRVDLENIIDRLFNPWAVVTFYSQGEPQFRKITERFETKREAYRSARAECKWEGTLHSTISFNGKKVICFYGDFNHSQR